MMTVGFSAAGVAKEPVIWLRKFIAFGIKVSFSRLREIDLTIPF
jgi:hypothetical protein